MKCSNPYITPAQTVAVMGYGVTGKAAMDYVLACGAKVIVSENTGAESFKENGDTLREKGIEFEVGGHTSDFLSQADIVLISPGISCYDPVVLQLKEKNIPVLGELGILAPVLKNTKLIGITGSNGKTTVTSLIGEALQKTGHKTFIGGNIGTPLYDYCAGKVEPCDVIVAEISSFQLESAGDFAPDISLLLNVTPDHLDWHNGMENYISAKRKIFAKQRRDQLAVVNGDDPNCVVDQQYCDVAFQTFGRSAGCDAFIDGNKLILFENGEHKELPLPEGTAGFALENFAAAALALRKAGLSFSQIEHCFSEFKRPPHRMEEVATVDNVLYINDSKATNTGAVIGALKQFRCPVVLIAGGRDKGEDYHQLEEMVKAKVKALVVIGESAGDIASALQEHTKVIFAESMQEAVQKAAKCAFPDDVVLLSPACASFDMFSGYAERGCCFRSSVFELQEKRR